MHDIWPFFVIFWCISAVYLVNQGDTDCPHVCIAHMSCFQSLYCYVVYIIYGASHRFARKLTGTVLQLLSKSPHH